MNDEQIDKLQDKLYKDLLNYVIEKKKHLRNNPQIDIIDSFPLIERTIYYMENSDAMITQAIAYYDEADICTSHAVNVAIFSLAIAMEMDLAYEELVELGAAGLMHDIGVAKIPARIIQKDEEELTEKEVFYFKQHSKLGYKAIEKFNTRLQTIADIIYQHHERLDGSGYPEGLENGELTKEGKILSLVDVYECIIHPRKHRDALVPLKNVQSLLNKSGRAFDPAIVTTLYNTLTVFPENVFVKLNSGEIGKVVQKNHDNPKHPKIKILYSSEGERIAPRILDLAKSESKEIYQSVPRPESH